MPVRRYVFTILKPWAKEWNVRRTTWIVSLDTIDAEHAGNASRYSPLSREVVITGSGLIPGKIEHSALALVDSLCSENLVPLMCHYGLQRKTQSSFNGCLRFPSQQGAPRNAADCSLPCCRLMNHSCEPSMQPFEVFQRRGYFRILFASTRHIYPGDELTIDYSAYHILVVY